MVDISGRSVDVEYKALVVLPKATRGDVLCCDCCATPLPAFAGAEGTTKALLAWGESRAAAAAARRVDRGAIVGFRSK